MPEKAKHFFIQRFFLKTIKIIQARLGRPAEKNGRSYMLLCPAHDFRQFLPVVYFFKRHLFNWCSGNDHSIKFTFLYVCKCFIKFIKMTEGSILRLMALHSHKSHINLQWCVGKRTQKLQFCLLFQRHQIQDQNLDWTDILMHGTFFIHHKYIFSLKDLLYWQIPLCFDRHC